MSVNGRRMMTFILNRVLPGFLPPFFRAVSALFPAVLLADGARRCRILVDRDVPADLTDAVPVDRQNTFPLLRVREELEVAAIGLAEQTELFCRLLPQLFLRRRHHRRIQ